METVKGFGGIFNGKTVFITGHTGFKGAWLALWLESLGAKVVGYALDVPTQPSLFQALQLQERIINITGDIRNREALRSALETHQPQFVFHLAAQSLVRLSYQMPVETFDTNIMGTANLLEVVRTVLSVRVCLVITSDKCYKNKEWIYAYRENDELGGYDPYSASKSAAEIVVSSYIDSFFNPESFNDHHVSLSSVRAGNVIGGGDWAEDRIIPDCIRALQQGKAINIRNPHAIRPWQHVLEPLAGYLYLAVKMWQEPTRYTGAWNFGPSDKSNVRVKDVVNAVLKHWGSGKWVDQSINKNISLHEANILKLDCSKANSLLNWRSILSFDDIIKITIDWYKAALKKDFDAYQYTLGQIYDYQLLEKNHN
jgi:CDP-glucose 4,6-dehydratase